MSNANSRAVGGTHYKGVEVEHWDYALFALDNRYLEGNITKYVARHRKKHGKIDLEKSKHYLQKLIESVPLLVQPLAYPSSAVDTYINHFCEENQLTPIETGIMLLMAKWQNKGDLEVVGIMIDSLISHDQLSEPTPGYVNQGG